jgi:hypothetical protein
MMEDDRNASEPGVALTASLRHHGPASSASAATVASDPDGLECLDQVEVMFAKSTTLVTLDALRHWFARCDAEMT